MRRNLRILQDDEFDLREIIIKFWNKKILIISFSFIFMIIGYVYGALQPQEFNTEIKLRNPPQQLFEPYSLTLNKNNNNSNNNSNNNNNNIFGQFISDFKTNFLSLDNLQRFTEESREFVNFKEHLKSKNTSVKKYFHNKINEVKEKNLIVPNKYFLLFTKELDGDTFLNNYVEFIQKKTVFEMKQNLKLSIENKIIILENALDKAKLINLENPILRSMNQSNQVVNEPEDLFYKGSKILSQEIIYLKKLLIKLENDQFNYEFISDKPLNSPVKEISNLIYSLLGAIFGLFFSLVFIYVKHDFKE